MGDIEQTVSPHNSPFFLLDSEPVPTLIWLLLQKGARVENGMY